MADETDSTPLSDDERAELEQLRAERARRQEEAKAAAEREELARLQREQEEAKREEHDRQVRERNAKLMEPDDDLKMPVGQKVVLVGILGIALAIILMMALGSR